MNGSPLLRSGKTSSDISARNARILGIFCLAKDHYRGMAARNIEDVVLPGPTRASSLTMHSEGLQKKQLAAQ